MVDLKENIDIVVTFLKLPQPMTNGCMFQ